MRFTPLRLAAILGCVHAITDAITGFSAGMLWHTVPMDQVISTIFFYNLIGFGLQPLFGLLVDRFQRRVESMIFGFALMGLGLILVSPFQVAAFFCLAIGSALFHVSAGAISGLLTPKKTIGAGLFTAPGVIGLTCGTILGLLNLPATVLLLGFVLLGLVTLVWTEFHLPSMKDSLVTVRRSSILLLIGALVLLVVGTALRSFVWTEIGARSIGWQVMLCLGIAAGVGKMLGSLTADRYGRIVVVWFSLFVAAIGLLQGSLPFMVLGTVGLQASTPIILATAVQWDPKRASLMAGLFLGLGIALGGWIYGTHILLSFEEGAILLAAILFVGGSTLLLRSKTVAQVRKN